MEESPVRTDQFGNTFTDTASFDTLTKNSTELLLAINPKYCKFLMGVADKDRTFKELDKLLNLKSESERKALLEATGKRTKNFEKEYPWAHNTKPLLLSRPGESSGGRRPTLYTPNIEAFLEPIAKMCFLNRYEPIFQDSLLKELYNNKVIREEILTATNRKARIASAQYGGLRIEKPLLELRSEQIDVPRRDIKYFNTVSAMYMYGFLKLPFSFAVFAFLHNCHEAGQEKVFLEPELRLMRYTEAELATMRRVKLWMATATIVSPEALRDHVFQPFPLFVELYHKISKGRLKESGMSVPSSFTYDSKDFESLKDVGGRLFHLYARYVYEDPATFRTCIKDAKSPGEFAHFLVPFHFVETRKSSGEAGHLISRLKKKHDEKC